MGTFIVEQEKPGLDPHIPESSATYMGISPIMPTPFLRAYCAERSTGGRKDTERKNKTAAGRKLCAVFFHGLRSVQADILRPFRPRSAAEMLLERHIKRIVGKPRSVIAAK